MPQKNTINDLRNHLFELIENLKDDEKKIDVDRAKLVIAASQQIIESAKVEVQFIEAIDSADATEFFDMQRAEKRRSLAPVTGMPEPRGRRIAE